MSRPVDRLAKWYSELSPASLDRIGDVYAASAIFQDPFNRVEGADRIAAIFRGMFESVDAPRFVVLEILESGPAAVLTWDFHFSWRGRPFDVHGATLVRFGDDGRVVMHRDYWDAAGELYEKMPLVGPMMRWLRSRMAGG